MLALLIASLASIHVDPFSVCFASMGSLCLRMCPKKSRLGDYPLSLAMLRHAAMAKAMFSFARVHLNIKDFIFLTAASASPLDSGLYAVASSCLMPLAVQYLANSPQNWGPPSVLMKLGQPNSVNHFVMLSHMLRVSLVLSFSVQA